jgi:hypothetical protein
VAVPRDRHDAGWRRSQGLIKRLDDLRSPGRAGDWLLTGRKAAR